MNNKNIKDRDNGNNEHNGNKNTGSIFDEDLIDKFTETVSNVSNKIATKITHMHNKYLGSNHSTHTEITNHDVHYGNIYAPDDGFEKYDFLLSHTHNDEPFTAKLYATKKQRKYQLLVWL